MNKLLRMITLMVGLLGLWGSETAGQRIVETPVARLGKGIITHIAFSPDGLLLAVAGSGGVWLYDATTLAEVGVLQSHPPEGVQQVVFSPDGRLLASRPGGHYPRSTVRLWDVTQRREVAVLEHLDNDLSSVAFSPDGQLLATGGEADEVWLWEVATRQVVAKLQQELSLLIEGGASEKRYSNVSSVAFSPDGQLLATGGEADEVWLWEVATRQVVAKLESPGGHTLSVAFSPDGRWLAAGQEFYSDFSGWNPMLVVWDIANYQRVYGQSHIGERVVFSPDGRWLAALNYRGVVLLEVATWQVVAGLTEYVSNTSTANAFPGLPMAFSPDGRLLAVGDYEAGLVRVWEVATRQVVAGLTEYVSRVSPGVTVAFSPDGRWLATGDGAGLVRVWEVATRQVVAGLWPEEKVGLDIGAYVHPVAFSPDGRLLAIGVGGRVASVVRVWEVATWQLVAVLRPVAVGSVAFSPDGRLLAVGGGDVVLMWETATWQVVAGLTWQTPSFVRWEGLVHAVVFSPDGRWLAARRLDGVVRVWKMTQPQLVVWDRHLPEWHSLAFSPDGRLLAVGGVGGGGPGGPGMVLVWETATWQVVAALPQRETVFTMSGGASVAFSPDGRWLAAGDGAGLVWLWEVASWETVAVLKEQRPREATSVVFHPDGQLLASSSPDGTVGLWAIRPTPAAPVTLVMEEPIRPVLPAPVTYALAQNYPNPFNSATTLSYDLPDMVHIYLGIYNPAGQLIRTLVQGSQQAGHYTVIWDSHDEAGRAVASGIYLYRLEVVDRGVVETKRMVLVR